MVSAVVDWHSWHEDYDRPDSALAHRLRAVQTLIRQALDEAATGPLRIVSLCAGQGRDLLEVLAGLDAAQQAADAADAQLALMERADALRKPQRFADLLETAAVLRPVDRQAWRARVEAVRGVDAGAIARASAGDPARIKEGVRAARLQQLRAGAAPL